jgi:hypothetical protein
MRAARRTGKEQARPQIRTRQRHERSVRNDKRSRMTKRLRRLATAIAVGGEIMANELEVFIMAIDAWAASIAASGIGRGRLAWSRRSSHARGASLLLAEIGLRRRPKLLSSRPAARPFGPTPSAARPDRLHRVGRCRRLRLGLRLPPQRRRSSRAWRYVCGRGAVVVGPGRVPGRRTRAPVAVLGRFARRSPGVPQRR